MNIAVLGTGKIVPTAIEAFQQISSYTIKAIYARPHSLHKAQDLSQKYHIEQIYTDYDALLAQKESIRIMKNDSTRSGAAGVCARPFAV